MKKPVILKNDIIVVGAATAVSVIGMFTAYRFGRKSEIKELIAIAADQGCKTFKFNIGGEITKVAMEIIE